MQLTSDGRHRISRRPVKTTRTEWNGLVAGLSVVRLQGEPKSHRFVFYGHVSLGRSEWVDLYGGSGKQQDGHWEWAQAQWRSVRPNLIQIVR